MDLDGPTILCRRCGQPVDEARAAEDYDAGVDTWELCGACAAEDAVADREDCDGLPS